MSQKDKSRTPNLARIVFSSGDYRHALECYARARDWLLYSGIAFGAGGGFGGVINSPQFRGKKVDGGVIPNEWIDQDGWQTIVELGFVPTFTIPDPATWLKEQQLPEDATLEFL
jgi:hypothetical protein